MQLNFLQPNLVPFIKSCVKMVQAWTSGFSNRAIVAAVAVATCSLICSRIPTQSFQSFRGLQCHSITFLIQRFPGTLCDRHLASALTVSPVQNATRRLVSKAAVVAHD